MSGPGLRSHISQLGDSYDLLAGYEPGGFFFERRGTGVSGMRPAAEAGAQTGGIDLADGAPAADDLLSQVAEVDPSTPGPVAVGAFPFAEGPGRLVVPSRAVRRTSRGTWQIDVWSGGLEPPDRRRARWVGRTVPHDAFPEIQLRPDPEPDDYAEAVTEATQRILRGELRKVVLARSLIVDAQRELDARQLLWRLRAVDPDCFSFAVPTPDERTLVGATPELLVAKHGREVTADPLAGSAPRFGDLGRDRASAERLLASSKDGEEHAVVAEAVEETLAPFCEALHRPSEPELLGTANVWHLSTPFQGRLRGDGVSVLDLVAALHPTPAVCGVPRDAARKALVELEPFDRGLYAGPVGWVDAAGDGEWAISLRCAEIGKRTARLFAGAGIVTGSEPALELDETERKFRALLDSLRWG